MSRVKEITIQICDICDDVFYPTSVATCENGHPLTPARFIRAQQAAYTDPAPPDPVDMDMYECCLRWLSTAPQTERQLVARLDEAYPDALYWDMLRAASTAVLVDSESQP